jgi:Spy/CpxP family protein refolding chaperone
VAKKLLIIALIVSVGVNLGVLSIFLFHLWNGHEMEHPMHKIMEQMKLTPEQKELMKEERERFEQKTEPIKDELAGKRSEVFDLLKETEVNTDQRDRLFSETAQLQAELEMMVFEHLGQVKQILTPEQQEIFFQHLEMELPHDGGDHPFGPPPLEKLSPPIMMEGPPGETPPPGPPPGFDEGK